MFSFHLYYFSFYLRFSISQEVSFSPLECNVPAGNTVFKQSYLTLPDLTLLTNDFPSRLCISAPYLVFVFFLILFEMKRRLYTDFFRPHSKTIPERPFVHT